MKNEIRKCIQYAPEKALEIYNELKDKEDFNTICSIVLQRFLWEDRRFNDIKKYIIDEVGEPGVYYNESLVLDKRKALNNNKEAQLKIIKEKAVKNKKEIGLNQQLGFGKYNKLKVKEIINSDPQYLKWAIENTDKKFAEEVKNALKLLNNNPNPNGGKEVVEHMPVRPKKEGRDINCQKNIPVMFENYHNYASSENIACKTLFSSIN